MVDKDEAWMRFALSLANTAAAYGEVPVGAIILCDGKVIGSGFNRKESIPCAMGHAELLAIEQASKHLGAWRLSDCELYSTLEPCVMCAGAIQQARIRRVVYGAQDPKGGALGSLYQIHHDPRLNHTIEVTAGVLAEEASLMLKSFFKQRRNQR